MIHRLSMAALAAVSLSALVAACGGGGDAPAASTATPAGVSGDCAAKRTQAGLDVVLLVGQSNMSGYGGYIVPGFDTTDPRIQQWSRAQKAILAVDPLEHPDAPLNVGRIGPGMAFARAHLKTLPDNRGVLLVPAAEAATSFAGGNWNPGNPLFEDAVARTNNALASGSGNCLAAVLWSQGESDVGRLSGAQYQAALDRMISTLRARVAGGNNKVPFLLGQFSPDWTGTTPSADQKAILDVINATPTRVPYTSVVSTTGLRSNLTQGLAAGSIHLDAASQRTYGARFQAALSPAVANTAGAAAGTP